MTPTAAGGATPPAPVVGVVAAASSASVLPAVSVPTISSTVDVPRPLSIGGGLGIASIVSPPSAWATDWATDWAAASPAT